MTENEKPSSAPEIVRGGYAYDSAEHLFAAVPILTMIASWTGRIGKVYIKNLVIAGKIKEARRNAAIIGTVLVAIVVLIIACMVWLASL
jgi:hypothetical protein